MGAISVIVFFSSLFVFIDIQFSLREIAEYFMLSFFGFVSAIIFWRVAVKPLENK